MIQHQRTPILFSLPPCPNSWWVVSGIWSRWGHQITQCLLLFLISFKLGLHSCKQSNYAKTRLSNVPEENPACKSHARAQRGTKKALVLQWTAPSLSFNPSQPDRTKHCGFRLSMYFTQSSKDHISTCPRNTSELLQVNWLFQVYLKQ